MRLLDRCISRANPAIPQAHAAGTRLNLQVICLHSGRANGALPGVGPTHTARMRRPADHDQVITTDMLIGCAGHRDHLNRVRRAKATGDRLRDLVVFPYIDS
jgi:hypothetical protein